MRHWIFHPLVFYPLAALLAAAAVLYSLQPQSWPRPALAQAGTVSGGVVVLDGSAFDAPASDPAQEFHVVRDGGGRARTLKIAVHPGFGPPSPQEPGVRLLMTQATAALIENGAVRAEVDYRSLPLNSAAALAVSLQGAGPAYWAVQPIEPGAGTLAFSLPAQAGVTAIGLRAIAAGGQYNEGVEILRVRIAPGG